MAAGCTRSANPNQKPLSVEAQKGQAIYATVCIACHNGNPKLAGSVGPAIAGSSRELIEARVLYGKYPDGYKPQRPDSHLMPQYPQYKNDIPAIYEYIKSLSE